MALRLYANSVSPFVRKVRIALYEKALDFEAVEIDSGARRAELLAINPRGEVPALLDGDAIVTGSAAICDYIEHKFPQPPLLPPAPAPRARCRWLESIADTHTDVLQFLLFLLAVRRPELCREYPAALPRLSDAVHRQHAFLNHELIDRDYLVGAFSLADVAFVPHLTSLAHLGEPVPDTRPHLRAWLARMLVRPSVERDAAQALAAYEASAACSDPFFRSDRIHWRGDRVEAAIRLGLGPWLLAEVEAGRAYFSASPGEPADR